MSHSPDGTILDILGAEEEEEDGRTSPKGLKKDDREECKTSPPLENFTLIETE